MTVRRLRKKQKGPKCDWCDEKAVYRGWHFTKFACSEHHLALDDLDTKLTANDSYESEAETSLPHV